MEMTFPSCNVHVHVCAYTYSYTYMHMHTQVIFMAISRTSFALRRCYGEWAPCSRQPLSSSWETTLTEEHMGLRYTYLCSAVDRYMRGR